MSARVLTICLLLNFLGGVAKAQEYSYTQYDVSDGLAGSTVYCITQDKEGFIWVGTETGVSRFDGTNFHNFTAVDGLPDVEILEMFGDSKGRVWMAPFTKSICYYYKGKIYNQTNDSLLHRMKFNGNIEHFAEDADGDILIQEPTALHLLRANGSVTEIDSINGQPIRQCRIVSRSHDGHFLVQEGLTLYSFSGVEFQPMFEFSVLQGTLWPINLALNEFGMMWWRSGFRSAIRSFATGKITSLPFLGRLGHISFSVLDDSLYFDNESTGATEYNLHTGRNRIFLPGKQVSRTFRDATGNIWFTTLGTGLFRLNSDEFRTVRLMVEGREIASACSITKIDNRLFVGDNHNELWCLKLPETRPIAVKVVVYRYKNRILGLTQTPRGLLVCGEAGTVEYSLDFHQYRFLYNGIKSLFAREGKDPLLGGYWGAGRLDLKAFKIDTFWHERSTAVFFFQDTILIGTLNGLYALAPDRSVTALGKKFPFLQKRISAMAESRDGTLWVASYDGGVIGYKGGQITATLSRQNGLTSDICRVLHIHGDDLWVGTDKGLNRVRLDQPGYPISRYTSKDGLGSDIINTVFADDSSVYVGTPAGLSYFNEAKVNSTEGCQLYWLSVINSGRERIGDTTALILPYTDKHLRLEFAGISYRSVGGISYRYRLSGLDTAWRTTKDPFLEFLSLPSGKYSLELQAMNKFGRKSRLLSLPFEVATPWWQTIWFDSLVLLSFLSLTWLFVTLRIRQIRSRQREKEQLNQRMQELEHMALQAQMNPHFIFNSLNSIQQYVFDHDVFAANKYLAGFSKLIRATLQNSSKAFILLSEEINYLSGYLALEKLRFKEKMDYSIDIDPALETSTCLIPPMLIQPYVENSMRHGLRHKVQGSGSIQIHFRHAGGRLLVTIEDNGIGRKRAAAYKTREHIEYQSKGMSLTADRIQVINSRYKQPIRVEVYDLEDDAGQPAGTRVVIELPLYSSENSSI